MRHEKDYLKPAGIADIVDNQFFCSAVIPLSMVFPLPADSSLFAFGMPVAVKV